MEKHFFTKITIVSNFKVLDFIYVPEKHPTAKQISFPLEIRPEAHLIFTKKLIDFSWEKDKENRQTTKRSLATPQILGC